MSNVNTGILTKDGEPFMPQTQANLVKAADGRTWEAHEAEIRGEISELNNALSEVVISRNYSVDQNIGASSYGLITVSEVSGYVPMSATYIGPYGVWMTHSLSYENGWVVLMLNRHTSALTFKGTVTVYYKKI